jgi:hypothetical protein
VKIGIITTLNHNIGDDFVRVGITKLLDEALRGQSIEYVFVNKHHPLTVYPPHHPLRWAGELAARTPRGQRWIERNAEKVLHGLGGSRFADCDVIVQSGAPVIFEGCGTAEWAAALWRHVVGRLHRRAKVMNLAAGTCYSWQAPPTAIAPGTDADFLREIAGYCRLTTTRERLADQLLRGLGIAATLMPCTAFLSGWGAVNIATESSPIFVNYMHGGGHYAFGQTLSPRDWQQTLSRLLARLSSRHKIVFLCHGKGEEALVRRDFPGYPLLVPNSVEEYYQAIAGAKFGVYNRLHASVALGGIGAPSLAIGTDTRMLMLEQIGIPARYVGDADADEMEAAVEDGLQKRDSEKERLLHLRGETWTKYLDLLSPVVTPGA